MEKYILKWHSHTPNVLLEIQHMLTRKLFTDVTLVSQGQSLQAHRLILSACSPYFKNMLAENPCTHPIILMTGTPRIIQMIVDFMYKGEIIVDHKDMAELLSLSEIMQIRGLPEICKQQLSSKQTGVVSQPAFIPPFVPILGPGGNTTILNAPNYQSPIQHMAQSPSQPAIETIVDHSSDSSETLDPDLSVHTPENPSFVERPSDKNKCAGTKIFDFLSEKPQWEVVSPMHSNDTILRYQSPYSTPQSVRESTSRLESSYSSAFEESDNPMATPKLKLQVQPLQLIELNLDKLVDLKQKIAERMSASKKETPLAVQKPKTHIELQQPLKPHRKYQPRTPILEPYTRGDQQPKRESTEKKKRYVHSSKAWNFFSWKEGWYAICDLCNSKVLCKHNTTKLGQHLDEAHPEVKWRLISKPYRPARLLEEKTSQPSVSTVSELSDPAVIQSEIEPKDVPHTSSSDINVTRFSPSSKVKSISDPSSILASCMSPTTSSSCTASKESFSKIPENELQSEIENPILDYEMEDAREEPVVQYEEITVQVSALPSVEDLPEQSVTLDKEATESSQNG